MRVLSNVGRGFLLGVALGVLSSIAAPQAAEAQCRLGGKDFASGKNATAYTSATVPFGQRCGAVTLNCKTTGSGKNKSSAWHLGSKKLSSVAAYSASCTVQEASCRFKETTKAVGQSISVYASAKVPFGQTCSAMNLRCNHTRSVASSKITGADWYLGSQKLSSVASYSPSCTVEAPPLPRCPVGKASVNYSFTDADGDNYYKAESGSVCLLTGQRLPYSEKGVGYAATVAAKRMESAECDSDRAGIVAVSYGAVDRDGDAYYTAESGRTCLMSTWLPAAKTVNGSRSWFAAAVPAGRSEPDSSADRNALVPIGSFTLVAPSEQGNGAFNGVENLYYDYFAPGLGFHYLNSIRQESMWNPEFMVHGVRVASVVGGSGEFSYWIQSFTEAYEAGSPQLAQVDGAGRVVISCGVAPGTEFELRVRDSRTGVQQGHRFRSAGDGSACAPPLPEPVGQNRDSTPTETTTPTPTETPTEPTPTPTEDCPETEAKILKAQPWTPYEEHPECFDPQSAYLTTTRETNCMNAGTLEFLGHAFPVAELPYSEKQYDGCMKCVKPGEYRVKVGWSSGHGSTTPRLDDQSELLNSTVDGKKDRNAILMHHAGPHSKLWTAEGDPIAGQVTEWSEGCLLLSDPDMALLQTLLKKHGVVEFTLSIRVKN